MTEFGGNELRKARENAGIRQRKKRNDLVARGLMNPDGTIARRRA